MKRVSVSMSEEMYSKIVGAAKVENITFNEVIEGALMRFVGVAKTVDDDLEEARQDEWQKAQMEKFYELQKLPENQLV